MSSRQERRREKAVLKKKLELVLRQKGVTDREARALLMSEIDRGEGTEVYRLDDDGTGRPMFFNISAMRSWAEKHSVLVSIGMDQARAEQLIQSGAVDPDHMFGHTLRRDFTPIIVCLDLSGSDQIVDGAHRYVAACMGASMMGTAFPVPAYVLSPDQWAKFVMSGETAALFEMG